jgi:predicted nuclease with TOPRIM domain
MKWKNELASRGLNESNISQGLKNKIRDVVDIDNTIKELKETLRNPSVNDDVDELEEAIQNAQEDLETLDNELVKAIDKFDRNKEKYAQLTQKMKEGRAKKKAGGVVAQPQAQPQVQQSVQAQPTPVTPTEEVKTEEKKKTSWGWVAFAVIGGIVTLGAVNFFNNRD